MNILISNVHRTHYVVYLISWKNQAFTPKLKLSVLSNEHTCHLIRKMYVRLITPGRAQSPTEQCDASNECKNACISTSFERQQAEQQITNKSYLFWCIFVKYQYGQQQFILLRKKSQFFWNQGRIWFFLLRFSLNDLRWMQVSGISKLYKTAQTTGQLSLKRFAHMNMTSVS